MERKKFFIINTALLDARNVQESTLAAYDKVIINASTVITSPASRALLDQYGVVINGANFISVEGPVRLSVINGPAEIKPGQTLPEGQIVLVANGPLHIAEGSEAVLSHYAAIQINGPVTCPESIAAHLTMANINGPVSTYPDGCIRLKPTAVLDRTFPLRAKEDALYYARSRVVALAPDIDFVRLAEKHVRFSTKALLVSESLAEAAVPLFNEEAEITVLPDGCAFAEGGAVLDDTLLRHCGDKLYVSGDLNIPRSGVALLGQLSYLRAGDLGVPRGLEAAVKDALADLDADYERIRTVAGTVLCDKIHVKVDRAMLEQAEDGLGITDCVDVKFAKDVPAQLLRERLISVTDCVNLRCTPEQRSAIELVAEDVVFLHDGEEKPEKKPGGPLHDVLQQYGPMLGIDPEALTPVEIAKLLLHSKIVNTASYEL